MPLSRSDWIVVGSIAALVLGVVFVVILTDPWEPEVPAVTAEIIADHPDDTLVFAIDVPLVYDASTARSFTVTPEAVLRGDPARVVEARALREVGRLADLILELTFDYAPPSQTGDRGATPTRRSTTSVASRRAPRGASPSRDTSSSRSAMTRPRRACSPSCSVPRKAASRRVAI